MSDPVNNSVNKMKRLWLQDGHLNSRIPVDCGLNQALDRIVFAEVEERYRRHRYHKQKIVFHKAAQRHFAEQLRGLGYTVDYVFCERFADVPKLFAQDAEWLVMMPTDWGWRADLSDAMTLSNLEWQPLEEDFLFLVERAEWPALLPAHKSWKMEPVYQTLRRRFGILMDAGGPAGGKWNYDHLNRKPAGSVRTFVEPLSFTPPDETTAQVIAEVNERYEDHPGSLERFVWPVTAEQAQAALQHFIDFRLADFGEHQDAMIAGKPFMAHSLLSALINVGLLEPREVLERVEWAWRQQTVGLPAAEGMIRQVLGWREYIRGVYVCSGESYGERNHFQFSRNLPAMYWGAETKMNCIRITVQELLENGYSHHIQRLMVLCNFALLSGVEPQQVNDWFNQMYIDSFDWVVTPNVIGMGLYADGGQMSTKPYVSSAQYLKKMSNYCSGCAYRPDVRVGELACPFNSLYWHFIAAHEEEWSGHHRMRMMVAMWQKMAADDRRALLEQATSVLTRIDSHHI